MINLALSLAASLLVFALFRASGLLHTAGSILPALLAGVLAYWLLARRTVRLLEGVMAQVQKELAGRKIDRAVTLLEGAFPLGRWQFLIASQLHGQIGSLLYVQKKFDDAEPHLEKSFVRMGSARAMLGAQKYRKKQWKEMEEAFEGAIRANKKDGLLYAVFAWCQERRGERARALAILQRGTQENPGDERLKSLLTRLQNDKRMKLEAYGEQWYQFWLETPPGMQAGAGGGFGPRPTRWVRR